MIFNSIEFLLFFLPATLATFYAAPRRLRVPVLLVSSLIFYASSGLVPAIFMVLCIVWAWAMAFVSRRRPGWPATFGAVAFPLGVLFMFRYLGFTLDNLGAERATRDAFSFFLSVSVPAGISFYSFQIASYSLDVADKRVHPERSLLLLATYISFFPQLIAGPIVRYEQLRDQLKPLRDGMPARPNFVRGLKFLSFGLFAKIFFADVFASVAKNYFDISVSRSAIDSLYSIFSYSIRIYFDFWSYSVMAIGLGLLFGIVLPRNFQEPYLACNPRDFWRRWHMSLSYWLRDYVYLKLGGNRAYARNIVIVFLTCGLWHGAGWNFGLWGAYHAALVLGYRVLEKPWDRLPRSLQIGVTYILVSFGWPLFYLDISGYAQLIENVFTFARETPPQFRPNHWLYLGAVTAFTFLTREDQWLYNDSPRRLVDSPVVQAGALSLALLFFQFRETFIYFRF